MTEPAPLTPEEREATLADYQARKNAQKGACKVPTLNAASMLFSLHAARRFTKRYRPDLKGSSERYTAEWANSALTTNDATGPFPVVPPDLAVALCDLVAAAAYAGTTVGGELWQAPDASGQQIPFVVRRDPKVGREVMVTVLPPCGSSRAGRTRRDRGGVPAAHAQHGRRGGDRRPQRLYPCVTPGASAAAPKALTKAAEDKANRAIALEWVRLAANEKKLGTARVNRETERMRGARNAANPTDSTLRHERDSAASYARRLREAHEHQDAELRRIKVALKIAIRTLAASSDTEMGAALAQIRAIDPGLLTPAFLADGQKIPKPERKRQSNEARSTHGYDPDAWKRVEGVEEAQA